MVYWNESVYYMLFITICVLVMITLVFLIVLREMPEQLLFQCSKQNWEGTLELHGDLGGTINCSKQKEDLFDNDNWAEICSDFPFSNKPSCRNLCKWDCEIENQKGGSMCVC